MRRSLIALIAVLALAPVAQAKDKTPPPSSSTVLTVQAAPLTPEPGIIGEDVSKDDVASPDYLPGDGSGQVGPLCAVAGIRSGYDGFSYDDTVTAVYHWCLHNGNVWDAYGWSEQGACQLLCDRNGKDEHGFGYGYWVRGYWTVFSISKYVGASWHTSATACVAVDGWFNVWGC
jgi:hypothetical protein